jgi:uncharacterized surface protein with fasciclin (FAS1) repeats/sporulation protein YlmC with PRC-barrel domain
MRPTPSLAAPLMAALLASPAAAQEVIDVLSGDDRFDSFAETLRDTGLSDELSGPLTVFAPTDEAFLRLPEALRDRLDDPEARDLLRRIAALHVITSGPHESDDLPVEMQALADDARIVVTFTAGALTLRPAQPDDVSAAEAAMRARAVTEARVRVGDIRAGDAIIHGIDMVLLPPDLDDRLAALDAQSPADGDGAQAAADGDGDRTDFATQIASSDDGETVDIRPDGGTADLVPLQDDDAPVIADVMEESDPVPEPQVFVYDPDERPTDDRPAPTPEVADVDELPGEIVTLPPSDAPTSLPVAESDAPTETEGPPGIDLAARVISVMDLIGQPVRDGAGAELGEVVDVLISMDGANARTLVYAETEGVLSLNAVGFGEPDTVRVDMRRVAVDPVDGTVIVQGDAD